MQSDDRKRRISVINRGQRVPNLYRRPKPRTDRREGDTFEVIYRDVLGKQRQKTLKARTIQRAIAEAEAYRTELRRGEVIAPSRLTLSEVANEYFEIMEALVATGERSQRTLDLYRQRYKKHIEPALGRRRVEEIRSAEVGRIFADQRREGLAAWTISGTQTILSAMFRFALTRGYIGANPLDRLSRLEKPRQVTRREARRLSDAEIRSICAAATPTYRPIVSTLAWTGLRVSEALALRWEDIDFDRHEVRVRHQLDDHGDLKHPKTRAGVRTVPLLPILEEELRRHRKRQLAVGLVADDRLVFTTATGKPLDRHNVRTRGVFAAADKAGLHTPEKSTVTTHDLRRTFISHLIVGLGLDPVRVARIAGHSNVSMTMNVYADEFDKAQHRDDLMARIKQARFGSV
jgi:integrase